MPRVAILGTGLIGASIGLGLKAHGPKDLEVVGFEQRMEHADQAKRSGAVDRAERNAADAVEGAALVILATPILSMHELMEQIAPALEPGVVVTDVGSTKAEVLRWGLNLLPEHAAFVGGHPMAGKTESGPKAAEAGLFEGARWVIVPPRSAPPDAVDVVAGLARMLGAKPVFMDAEEHDAYVAAISHLPMVAATALFRLTRASEAWPELSLLAAGGFRDTTRLTGTDPTMAHDIVLTNRQQIAHWLERYRAELRELQAAILDAENEDDLYRLISEANVQYTAFRQGAVGRKEIDQAQFDEMHDVSIMDLLLGSQLAERARELSKRAEERIQEAEQAQRAGARHDDRRRG